MTKPTSGDILRILNGRGGPMATYVVKNWLRSSDGGGFAVETPWILRKLKQMEASGLVRRVPNGYAVMLSWEAKP